MSGLNNYNDVMRITLVPREGFEPSSLSAYAPEAYMFASFTTWAGLFQHPFCLYVPVFHARKALGWISYDMFLNTLYFPRRLIRIWYVIQE